MNRLPIEHLFVYSSGVSDRRAQALAALAAVDSRVRPVALAHDRILGVLPGLAPLLPDGGLRRGSVLDCRGSLALSTALALVAEASRTGSWLGVVGVPGFGAAAAAEWGVALERVVHVPVVPGPQLPTVLAAVADGVDLVMASVSAVKAADARRLTSRLVTRGGVLVLVGDPGGFAPDLVCRAVPLQWCGLESGAGRLTARRVRLEVAGRRSERPRRADWWWPGPDGTPSPVSAPGESRPASVSIARVG